MLPPSPLSFSSIALTSTSEYTHLVNAEVTGAETADDCRLYCTLKGLHCDFYVYEAPTGTCQTGGGTGAAEGVEYERLPLATEVLVRDGGGVLMF